MDQEIMEDIGNALVRFVSWIESTRIYERFTAYPRTKQISYVTHAWRNAKSSIQLGYLAIRMWFHAFFPFLFVSSDHSLHPLPSIRSPPVDPLPAVPLSTPLSASTLSASTLSESDQRLKTE